MKHPRPTRSDVDQFCKKEGWQRVRDARGRTGTHHITYELVLADGRVLRTRVSHPPDRTDIGKSWFAHILRDQLQVSEGEFWSCVKGKGKPDRGIGRGPSADSIPADLVHALIHTVGLAETEIRRMSKDDAVARMQEFWTTGN